MPRARHQRCDLDLDLGAVLHQTRNFDHRHGRIIASHDGAIRGADLRQFVDILLTAGDIPGQANDMLGLTAGAEDFLTGRVEQRDELAPTPDVLASAPAFENDVSNLAGLLSLGETIWG